ncbi:MAG: hypothetical protein KJ749_12325, partial [Planctomycetes bacterium]|nr:hypothetical protein [Planctomycetota bacterium]
MRAIVWFCSVLSGLAASEPGHSPVAEEAAPAPAPSWLSRVVHDFDFDERKEGNLEDVPKFWTSLRPPGFPRFSAGHFDFEVGHKAPPSFYLECNGRSVAYQYNGAETRVRASSEYRIEGFVRPDRLRHARACLNAHFLDRQGNPILESFARTPFIGGPDQPDGWVRFELYLPAAPPEAETIGLIAWVMQEPMWNTSLPAKRYIPSVDVYAGAWFDDLTIHALPRVEVSTTTPGNILPPDGPQMLRVLVAETEVTGLTGRLTIKGADRLEVESHVVPVSVGELAEPTLVSVGHLLPGYYEAHLEVFAGDSRIAARQQAFVRLAPLHGEAGVDARSFGVVVDPKQRADAESELSLLSNMAARAVKLPVWTGLADLADSSRERRSRDRILQELVAHGFALTGVFWGSPSEIVRADGPYPRPLIDLLSEPPSVWSDHLAAVVAPYASAFHWWQVGPDTGDPLIPRDKLTFAVEQLRAAMGRFVTVPLLALPTVSSIEPGEEKWPVPQVAVALGSDIQPDAFADRLNRFRQLGYNPLTVYVEPLPAARYHRIPRLADWAQRIITARFAGADTVFVPQPWHLGETAYGQATEPAETYLLLRTIADVVGGAIPANRVRIAPGVECLAFNDDESTVLAIWDKLATGRTTRYAVQLGSAPELIDLWGRVKPFEYDDRGRQIVELSSMPILVAGVERWLIDFRNSVTLRPAQVNSGTELVEHTIELVHHGSKSLSGSMFLQTPEGWEVTPRNLSFALMPKRPEQFLVKINYPHSEVAGVHPIIAKIAFEGRPEYMEVPLPIEIGLPDVVVSGWAVLEGKDLVVRHIVTNRSK